MRVLVLVGCALVIGSDFGRAADTDEAAVREHSGRYSTAVLKKDVAGLLALLHKDYQGRDLPGVMALQFDRGRQQAVDYWTDPGRTVPQFEARVEGVRLFEDTAVETGSFFGTFREHGSNGFWGGKRYTRVWLRDGQGWRLAHEQY
jgi:ketosteroid isomerase-like protein